MISALWKLAAVAVLGPAAAGAAEPALVIERGSVAARQVVALGRDLVVEGEASSDVAVVNGSVRVAGRVVGDVIVLGGEALLGPRALVEGDVFVLGGRLTAEEGSRIGGRSVSYPSVGAAWVMLLGGPSVGQPAFSRMVVGAKLALLAAWLAWALLLFATGGREVLSISSSVAQEPFRNFLIGLAGVLAIFLTALLCSAFAAALVGLPLLLLAVLLAVLLKLWGLVAVFHALGHAVTARILRRRWIPLNEALLGLALLGLVKLLPWAGAWTWTAVSLVGIGATLATKFGRRQSWFESAALRPQVT